MAADDAGVVGAVADAVAEADVEPGEGDDALPWRRPRRSRATIASDGDDDAAAPLLAAAHPENDRARAIRTKTQPAPAGGLREEHGDGDADEAEADERPGPVAALGEHLLRDRLVARPLRG